MNEHEIETLLSELQPRGPSASLSQGIAKELEQDREWMLRSERTLRPIWLAPLSWSAAGAAAAVLVMSVFSGNDADSPSALVASAPDPYVMPVTTIREVVDARNEGIQYNSNSRLPEQRVRLTSMERHAWIDPRDGAHITLERPREESVVLPVSFQ
ncbi:hypothetical protein EI77_00381 [Prosthecobacter fusiformis]|uniref:Uncharacterized protein n=1 Tax=Prosthecobacter fusiformis TaxID=48464 RepID=A0A4R7SR34_9BACT|nr:hypothetical protein [Prosthecobacter fusiformis]TDU81079.1 hypothetical protein EI77_00381 [Prosthecobacter fusiformis]